MYLDEEEVKAMLDFFPFWIYTVSMLEGILLDGMGKIEMMDVPNLKNIALLF